MSDLEPNQETDEGVVAPDHVGQDRRTHQEPGFTGSRDRRSQDVENLAFRKAVASATLASTREITKIYLRRLAWLMAAVAVAISSAIALPVALNEDAAKTEAVKNNCHIILAATGVFTNFFNYEIALRKAQLHDTTVTPGVKAFDHAEINHWENFTSPAIRKFQQLGCTSSGAIRK